MKSNKIIFFLNIGILLLCLNKVFAQDDLQKRWHLLDFKKDGVYGISMDRAYTELLKGKQREKIIIAVIDGGVDINHKDLKSSIYTNLKEIPGNVKDDDKNGYIDDLHGWNFMGSSKGSFMYDNMDMIRELRIEKIKKTNSKRVKELQRLVNDKMIPLKEAFDHMDSIRLVLNEIKQRIGKKNPTVEELKNYKPQNATEAEILFNTVKSLQIDSNFNIEDDLLYQKYKYQLDYMINIEYNPRKENNEYNQKYYGNADVKGVNAFHGTHVAGIIASYINNNIRVTEVDDALIILPIRAIPIGDAYDHDVANAIRYGVNMGAKIINLSYAKSTSPGRIEIDEAEKYAMDKDVLIVHGAGNDHKENIPGSIFPTKFFLNGQKAEAWLEVGASGKDSVNIVADFSNYSQNLVDVFAPGVSIYSTIPGNKYMFLSGTSMAAPVVAGLAGMIRAYFPKLTANQVKDILMKSVVKIEALKDKCISGGIINAYNAFELASEY